ncbi:MAG: hypothetical protein COU08_02785 [Candidatus Harrisonbacteria bacterium CG10_big_fil_rev_8_21_14_0_10_42_17]|uniref:Type IV secretion system coupling protein TraD DNA-binding domain-containing protein n=1 Tax=Candidatus Harrisonbacteria bacterium CG10_big_fil_rev_8_21_14_0_10_42_17 TaxID=1974584 RepID=A0A2M6WI28_9BACT|nr:MAG: hypothetical protein COU08_02785 [Candidatus Harrisonbacteria bacterium CG10_big_fil_rev_8_21_14_0_10_42_17]
MEKPTKIQIIKYAPPPTELPIYGCIAPEDALFIGRTNYVAALEEKRFVFGIKRADKQNHIYIIGKRGMGKSKLMELLIRQDVAYGYGLCLMDPYGTLIDAILDFIPEERISDVVIIDPTDNKNSVAFNPLINVKESLRHQVSESILEAMRKQLNSNWTPRLEHVFRCTCRALLDYPEATMKGMILMLSDERYRERAMPYIKDDIIKRFWEVEFPVWLVRHETEAVIPIINKVSQFLSDPLVKAMFDQAENKLDIETLIQENKILLVNLAKSKIGDENASLFGSMLITRIKQAGIARSVLNHDERVEFSLYIDEFQHIATSAFEHIVSEGNNYGFSLTLAHQNISQLPDRVRINVLGNVDTLIIFRIGTADAEKLVGEMSPVFEAKDMTNLGARQFYIKMGIDGETSEPFSAETLNILKPNHPSYRATIINQSQKKYGKPTVAEKII